MVVELQKLRNIRPTTEKKDGIKGEARHDTTVFDTENSGQTICGMFVVERE